MKSLPRRSSSAHRRSRCTSFRTRSTARPSTILRRRPRSTASSPRSSATDDPPDDSAAREVARDVLLVRFERAAADLDELGVAEELFDAEFGAVAVAAEDLDRGVGDFLGGGGGEQLGGVG